MTITEKQNESAKAGKAGERSNGKPNGAATSATNGSGAHEDEGSQEKVLTSREVTDLLKQGLNLEEARDPGEETPPEEGAEHNQDSKLETRNSKGDEDEGTGKETNREGAEKNGAEKNHGGTEAQRKAAKEAEELKGHIAELESKLDEAEEGEKAALQTEIEGWRKDLEQWEAIAKGEVQAGPAIEGGTDGAEVPEALQSAITEWEEKGGGELPPALQVLVEGRIHKLTSQRETEKARADQAESRVQELESELQTARAGGANGSGPVMDEKRLATFERTARQLVTDAENYLDETATEQEKERVEKFMESERLDLKGLKRRMRELQQVLAGVPAERQRIQEFRKTESAIEVNAKQWFPFLYDKADPDYQEAQKVLEMFPDLTQRTPAHRMAVGLHVLGLREFRRLHPEVAAAAGSKAAQPRSVPRKAPRKSPTSVSGAAAPAAARKTRNAEEESARKRFEEKPSAESVQELIKIGLRS